MNAVALAATPTLTRRTGIACSRCGEGRPASHVRCYVCGQRLTGESEPAGRLGRVRRLSHWPVWGVRWLFSRLSRRQPVVAPYGVPVLQLRTWGDRAARWYTYLSVAAVALWLVGGSRWAT